MPIVKLKTKEEFPAELHEFVKESADKAGFEVNLSPTAKVDEFRTKNIDAMKKIDDLTALQTQVTAVLGEAKWEDFVKEVGELRGTAQQVKDGKIKATTEIEAEVTKRTETMRGTLEAQIRDKATEAGTWKSKYEAADATLRMSKVDNAINALAGDAEVGLNPKAVPDVLARARAVFEVQPDGSFVPKKNGEILRGEDGVAPMTPKEWLKGLRKEADYFFLGSKGGGAGGEEGGAQAKFGGMTEKAFNALSPLERLKIANRIAAK